jgi:hypothetical protein
MFDSEGLAGLSGGAVAALVADTYRIQVEAETALLVLAAHWADLHAVDLSDPRYSVSGVGPGVEECRRLGGVGTPAVREFAAAELGTLQHTTTAAAARQMADALDLRHRLPLLWRRVQAGQVRGWQARKVAQATRQLSAEAAGFVDRAVATPIGSLPWARFEPLLGAAVIAADPHGAAARAKIWEAERFVRTGRTREGGLKVLVARANAGDVIWFMAMVNRIADILHTNGDTDPVDIRRSKAIGVLAQPASALQLLRDHQHDTTNTPDPACGPDEDPGEAAHRSVRLDRPTVDPDKARPNVTLYVHLSQEALVGAAGSADCPRCNNASTGASGEAASEPAGSSEAAAELQVSGKAASKPAGSHEAAAGLQVSGAAAAEPAPSDPTTPTATASGAAEPGGPGHVGRIEDVGPVTIEQIRRFLGGSHCRIRVQPVLDPNPAPVDSYEIPTRTREALRLRNPASIFPFAPTTSRTMDLDHTTPYLPPERGGPPGQTGLHNLGPLSRSQHRLKTFGRWRPRQPEPGLYLWRSPHGWIYLATNTGTQDLGNNAFAHAVWKAARQLTNPARKTAGPTKVAWLLPGLFAACCVLADWRGCPGWTGPPVGWSRATNGPRPETWSRLHQQARPDLDRRVAAPDPIDRRLRLPIPADHSSQIPSS